MNNSPLRYQIERLGFKLEVNNDFTEVLHIRSNKAVLLTTFELDKLTSIDEFLAEFIKQLYTDAYQIGWDAGDLEGYDKGCRYGEGPPP